MSCTTADLRFSPPLQPPVRGLRRGVVCGGATAGSDATLRQPPHSRLLQREQANRSNLQQSAEGRLQLKPLAITLPFATTFDRCTVPQAGHQLLVKLDSLEQSAGRVDSYEACRTANRAHPHLEVAGRAVDED